MTTMGHTLTSAIFVILGLWHLYWAAGGKLAHGAAIPTRQDGSPLFRPSAAGTAAVGTALLACAALVAFNARAAARHRRRALDALGRRAALGLLARAIGDFGYVGFFKRKGGDPFAPGHARLFAAVPAAGRRHAGRVLATGLMTPPGPATPDRFVIYSAT